MLISKSEFINDLALNRVIIRHCMETMWSTFDELLVPPLTGDNLAILSDVLTKNEERPLPPASDDGIEWLNTFTGPNFRLEMLGLLFCFLGRAYLCLQEWVGQY